MLETPVLLIIFNRPNLTEKALNAIARVKPRRLFIAADGPRPSFPDDAGLCMHARQIATSVSWDCEISTLFQEKNIGCGRGPAGAIDWLFKNTKQGIILEDDCIPHPSFFKFCEELLHYYRDEPKVMHISGDNFQFGRKRGKASYYFSKYTHNSGWATWRRAWKYFDFSLLPEGSREHIWDIQWRLSVDKQDGVSILPNQNLVTYIGIGPDATHTKTIGRTTLLQAGKMIFPLVHPKKIELNNSADAFTKYFVYRKKNKKLVCLYRVRDYLQDKFPGFYQVLKKIKDTIFIIFV